MRAKEFITEEVGYKVMRYDPNTGKVIAGADSRLSFIPNIGQKMSMPGNGIYMSTDRNYVLTYYSELADHEVLITFEFDPNHITFGNLTDRETEFAVPSARIKNIEKLS